MEVSTLYVQRGEWFDPGIRWCISDFQYPNIGQHLQSIGVSSEEIKLFNHKREYGILLFQRMYVHFNEMFCLENGIQYT